MKNIYIVFLLICTTYSGFSQEDPKWKAYWKDGMRVESLNGDFKLKLGGRFMLDGVLIFPDPVIDTLIENKSGVEIRRIRLYSSGLIYRNIKYKLQFDFAGGVAEVKDAYIAITKIPFIGNIQVGHFKEPLGLELLTSSKYITMIERSLTNPLFPERNTGLMLFNTAAKERMTWAAGYFVPSNRFGEYLGNKYHLTGRVTGLPIHNTESKYQVLHLGVGYTYQYQHNETYILKSRPESHLMPTLVLAEIDHAKAVNQLSGELALILGPFHIQTEYVASVAQTTPDSELQKGSYYFQAYHGIVSWFITGEHKNYMTKEAAFGRVKPKNNFGSEGAGAFELAFRYSNIDLDDTDVRGGYMSNATLGLNWYLNPATRFMFNYVFVNIRDTGTASIMLIRFQVDF